MVYQLVVDGRAYFVPFVTPILSSFRFIVIVRITNHDAHHCPLNVRILVLVLVVQGTYCL